MAVTVSTQVNPVATKLVVDSSATSTAASNTTGGSGNLYMVEIDNDGTGTPTTVYLKMANASSATGGTTTPDLVLMIPAEKKITYAFPESIAFGTGFCHWCVKEAATTGTTNPDTTVIVRYLTS
tara:strand:- start:181 stop:552 length:372 start_codon:yes stop_codon:yes gene_type:complete